MSLMPYLLNVVYLLLLVVLSPYLVWQAIRKGKYREGFSAKFLGQVPLRTTEGTCLWFHAVSLGEVNLLAPLLREIAARHPDWQCVISTTTLTGMAQARKKYAGAMVFYCPLDFSWAVRRAMRRIRPALLVLAELELWPNLIRAAGENGAAVAVVNGRLGQRSFNGYRRIRPLVASVLRRIGLAAVQDATYADRFRLLGTPNDRIVVTGSMKYDGSTGDRQNPATQRLRQLAGFAADDTVFLAGSTQEPEESLALEAYRRLASAFPRLRLVVVPRHPERFESVAQALAEGGLPWQRRSRLDADGADPAARVLLVDTVGELGAWWGTADIAFVGGSLGKRGGQNMIEPAAFGAAVSFGPNTWNFRDIVQAMLDHEAARVVRSGDELHAFVRWCLECPADAATLGLRARQFVASQQGATRRTVDALEGLLTATR